MTERGRPDLDSDSDSIEGRGSRVEGRKSKVEGAVDAWTRGRKGRGREELEDPRGVARSSRALRALPLTLCACRILYVSDSFVLGCGIRYAVYDIRYLGDCMAPRSVRASRFWSTRARARGE